MKKLLLVSLLFVGLNFGLAKSTFAISRVGGYYKPSTGRYVMPYYRSTRNSYKIDNYSTRGNYNPFTGKKGYKSLY